MLKEGCERALLRDAQISSVESLTILPPEAEEPTLNRDLSCSISSMYARNKLILLAELLLVVVQNQTLKVCLLPAPRSTRLRYPTCRVCLQSYRWALCRLKHSPPTARLGKSTNVSEKKQASAPTPGGAAEGTGGAASRQKAPRRFHPTALLRVGFLNAGAFGQLPREEPL